MTGRLGGVRALRVWAALAAAAAAVAVGIGVDASGTLQGLENDAVDLRFQLRGAETPSDMLVVGIDDVTFSELDRAWPFPRSLHARVIDRLHAAGARHIAYDVQFTEPTRPREDLALYDAVGRARPVTLATSEVDAEGRTNVLGGDDNLARAGARAGAASFPTEAGEIIRRSDRSALGISTMSVVAVEAATKRRVPAELFPGGHALIDYRGPPGTIETVSFSDVLRGRVDPARIRGRIVVVGATAPTLQDIHATPTAGDRPMAGAEVQANAIWTLLHGNPLRPAPAWWGVLAIVLMGVACPLAGARWRPLPVAALAVPLALAALVGAQALFEGGIVVEVVPPLLALAVGAVGVVVVTSIAERREGATVARRNEVLEARVRERTRELYETQLEVISRLCQAAETRDDDTGRHIARMSGMCEALGLALGMSAADAELLRHASALHDVGKIGIPDRILLKPGRFDDEERAIMQTHTTIGATMLAGSSSQLLQMAEVIALTHHERWDGTGYPAGLAAEEIPLMGRICAICDVFDALCSPRPYKDAWSLEEAVTEIERSRGSQFDPSMMDAFLAIAPALHERFWGPSGSHGAEPPVAAAVADLPA